MGNPEQEPKVIVDATSANETSSGIDYEKRFKDTQGAFTKSQQELKALQAKNKILEEMAKPKVELDEATKTELNDLKFSDPDAWRIKMNELEIEAHTKHRATLNEAEVLVNQQTELESRTQVLAEFQASHPDVIINDEVIQYDVPPRITKRLENGEISFGDFLNEVNTYLGAPKVVGDGNKTLNQPNLNSVGGDDTPTDGAIKKDIVKDYANSVF